MNFKRCSTVAALLLATAVPAFADSHETVLTIPEGFSAPPGSILLTFTNDDELYVVPISVAAEFCDVGPMTMESLATDPQTEVIYCETLDEARFTELVEAGSITALADFEDSDDDDDDGDFGDDVEETAADEANDEDGDGIFDEDDNDTDEEGPDGLDDSADGDDGEGENAPEGEDTDGSNDDDADGSPDDNTDASN